MRELWVILEWWRHLGRGGKDNMASNTAVAAATTDAEVYQQLLKEGLASKDSLYERYSMCSNLQHLDFWWLAHVKKRGPSLAHFTVHWTGVRSIALTTVKHPPLDTCCQQAKKCRGKSASLKYTVACASPAVFWDLSSLRPNTLSRKFPSFHLMMFTNI